MSEHEIVCVEPEVDYMVLDRIIRDEFGANKERLIMIMQAIQREYRFLPEAALRYLAFSLGVPLARIYEIATFYASFALEPKGKHILAICTGTACHLKGTMGMVQHVVKKMGVTPGKTTQDMKLTLETVHCLGACAVAPVVVIDDEYYPKADITVLNKFIDELKTE